MNWTFFEWFGLAYLLLCLVLILLFAVTTIVQDVIWRRRQRKRAKSVYIREWRLP